MNPLQVKVPTQIKTAMWNTGHTERTLAKELGISQPHLHFMLVRVRPSERYQGRIARILREKKAVLFPNDKSKQKSVVAKKVA